MIKTIIMLDNMKYFKLVFGFGELDYIPVTSDELHKAQYISMYGGKANFEEGFINNRGNDVIRITEDWNKAMGWNKGHKLDLDDMVEVRKSGLEKSYKKTKEKGKLLAEYIKRENKLELLSKPASEVYNEFIQLQNNQNKQLHD